MLLDDVLTPRSLQSLPRTPRFRVKTRASSTMPAAEMIARLCRPCPTRVPLPRTWRRRTLAVHNSLSLRKHRRTCEAIRSASFAHPSPRPVLYHLRLTFHNHQITAAARPASTSGSIQAAALPGSMVTALVWTHTRRQLSTKMALAASTLAVQHLPSRVCIIIKADAMDSRSARMAATTRLPARWDRHRRTRGRIQKVLAALLRVRARSRQVALHLTRSQQSTTLKTSLA